MTTLRTTTRHHLYSRVRAWRRHMRPKRALLVATCVVASAVSAVAVFAGAETSAYDDSVDRVYDVPLPNITHSTNAAVIARGQHVVDAIAGCSSSSCHGADLGGGRTVELGPVGRFTGPNVSAGGLGVAYSDGQLARLIRYGIKLDGRTVRFMPVQDFRWLPDDDVAAVISYLRSAPASDRPNGPVGVSALGKVLDRRDKLILDVARRVGEAPYEPPPLPSASADYGRFLANGCTGCHGEHLSGGRIPGTPPSIPVPLDLTPHEEGLAHWTFGDFDRAITRGLKPNGQTIDPFMPTEGLSRLSATEKQALWAYLQSVPPRPFGER